MPKKANRDCLAAALLDSAHYSAHDGIGQRRRLECQLTCRTAVDGHRQAIRPAAARYKTSVATTGDLRTDHRREAWRNSVIGKVAQDASATRIQWLLRFDDDTDNNDANQSGSGSFGEPTNSPMQIVRLPMPESCNPAVRRIALARSGASTQPRPIGQSRCHRFHVWSIHSPALPARWHVSNRRQWLDAIECR